ncbi:hypothetical protein EVG20_g7044 [Dentipellis fragilis]|uniref:Uncharacterized protein n=1 Tax=Dentipellis fragilis TaxID=205917 RepID=A0A4Y9YHK0_9AGAM|nr:hypothetical protein EVG20_g7044 [Dentipellis fragilis]
MEVSEEDEDRLESRPPQLPNARRPAFSVAANILGSSRSPTGLITSTLQHHQRLPSLCRQFHHKGSDPQIYCISTQNSLSPPFHPPTLISPSSPHRTNLAARPPTPSHPLFFSGSPPAAFDRLFQSLSPSGCIAPQKGAISHARCSAARNMVKATHETHRRSSPWRTSSSSFPVPSASLIPGAPVPVRAISPAAAPDALRFALMLSSHLLPENGAWRSACRRINSAACCPWQHCPGLTFGASGVGAGPLIVAQASGAKMPTKAASCEQGSHRGGAGRSQTKSMAENVLGGSHLHKRLGGTDSWTQAPARSARQSDSALVPVALAPHGDSREGWGTWGCWKGGCHWRDS